MHWLTRISRLTIIVCMGIVLRVGDGVWADAARDDKAPRSFDFGFIASRHPDIHGVTRLKALGPFFEHADDGHGQRLTAFRPWISRYTDLKNERARREILWPLHYDKTFRNEAGGRTLVAFWHDFDTTDKKSRYRFWLFPFYFQGRDTHGDAYGAVFPFGGHIYEFLGQDKIVFWLFPLYSRHQVNEVVTRSWLWPVYSRTEGNGIYRFRVFPFYGQAKHRDKYSKKFVLWPFWTSARYYYPGSSGYGYVLFPLYGRIKVEDQSTWMVAPPLFRVSRGDRMNWILAPWPFVQIRTGEVNQRYFWPVYGKKQMRGVQSRFVLWPFIFEEQLDRGAIIARRSYILPFYYADVHRSRVADEDDAGQVTQRYHKLWPLFSYWRDGDQVRMRSLDLWPLKNTPAVERNWSPLWTLYSHTASGENRDTEILWGVYRRHVRGEAYRYTSMFPLVEWGRDSARDRRHWSLLKGLFGVERHDNTTHYRLLYLIKWQTNPE